MKFLAIPILILLLMTQTFSKWFVVLSFNLNRDYIAKKLCENQYKPKLHCKGSCVLMKKMQQEKRQEQNNPAPVQIETSNIVLSSRSFFATALSPVFMPNIYYVTQFDADKPVDRTVDIFHPPAA